MMLKRILLAAMALVCTFSLTGCYAPLDTAHAPAATLAPADAVYTAPVGDEALSYTSMVPLYLPSLDGQRLLTQYAAVELNHGQHSAESIVRALLSYPSNDQVVELGAGVGLALYGPNPVEVSGGVCTVNLTSSALQLEHDAFYNACLSLSATLCELEDVHYVNILVADQAVGMDITGSLPLGSVTAHPGEELPVLWEQLEARRVPLGASPSTMPLTAAATLYFPLQGGKGIMAETRNLTFAGQAADQLATGLLSALSAGARYLSGACAMPDISQMMSAPPLVADLDAGGRMINLYFHLGMEETLQASGIDTACFIASLTTTLTTFIPSISSIRIYVGETPYTTLDNPRTGSLVFPGGLIQRQYFANFFMGQATLYFSGGQRLKSVLRAMPDDEILSPRSLLAQLMLGPNETEAAEGIAPSLPDDLSNADVLGLSLTGDTLLVNLSSHFADSIRENAADWEQAVCYGMVNTLCQATGARRVRFFFAGEMLESIGGTLYWGGEFLYNPGMIDQTLG